MSIPIHAITTGPAIWPIPAHLMRACSVRPYDRPCQRAAPSSVLQNRREPQPPCQPRRPRRRLKLQRERHRRRFTMTTADDALSPSDGSAPTHRPRRSNPSHAHPSSRGRHRYARDLAHTSSPSPADMPRHRSDVRDTQPRSSTACGQWVIVETLSVDARPSVIIDGRYRRHFANLNRVSIATSAGVARRLQPVVDRCALTRQSQLDTVHLPSRSILRIVAIPVLGLAGSVYGVGLWAGTKNEATPPMPLVGAIEWNALTGVAHMTADAEVLLGLPTTEILSARTPPDLMSHFDRWDDRHGFLALFDPVRDSRRWSGSIALSGTETHGRRHLHIAATTDTLNTSPAIRGLLFDISFVAPAPPADVGALALHAVPTSIGHSIGMIDLPTGLIYDWITVATTFADHLLHTNPEIHPDDLSSIAQCRLELLHGTSTATATFRMRFSNRDDWTTVDGCWLALRNSEDRPQALLDIVVSR